jgi:hypothetical protein
LERRKFIKGITLLGGLALLSSVVPSCLRRSEEPVTPSNQDTSTDTSVPGIEEAPVAKVSLIRSQDRGEGVRRAVASLQYNPVQGKTIAHELLHLRYPNHGKMFNLLLASYSGKKA